MLSRGPSLGRMPPLIKPKRQRDNRDNRDNRDRTSNRKVLSLSLKRPRRETSGTGTMRCLAVSVHAIDRDTASVQQYQGFVPLVPVSR